MSQTNINLKQLNSIISNIVEEKMDVKTELKNAYDQLKRAKQALRDKGKKHGELKELTKALRKASDEIMELDDAVVDEVRENDESEVMERNEKSKSHGKYFSIDENKKTKVVKLKESDLRSVIKRVIEEQEKVDVNIPVEDEDGKVDMVKGISMSTMSVDGEEEASVEEVEDADILVDDDLEADVDENELADDEDSWVAERWEDLTDAVRNIFSRNKKFFGCRGKGACPDFNRMNRRRKLRILTNLTIAFPKFRWPKFRFRLPRPIRYALNKWTSNRRRKRHAKKYPFG